MSTSAQPEGPPSPGTGHGPSPAPRGAWSDGSGMTAVTFSARNRARCAAGISLVAQHRIGSGPRPPGPGAGHLQPVEQRREDRGVVRLTRGHQHYQRTPTAVDQGVDLAGHPGWGSPSTAISRNTEAHDGAAHTPAGRPHRHSACRASNGMTAMNCPLWRRVVIAQVHSPGLHRAVISVGFASLGSPTRCSHCAATSEEQPCRT